MTNFRQNIRQRWCVRLELEHKKFRKFLLDLVHSSAFILCCAIILSFFARLHWFTDLFSHFVLQYLIGAVLLGIIYAFMKRWALVVVMVAIGCYSYTILRPNFFNPSPRSMATAYAPSGQIRVLQYNRLFTHSRQEQVKALLEQQSADVVILQEANQSLSEMALSLKSLYPHQIHEPRPHAFGMVILSKYAFEKAEPIHTGGLTYQNFALRFVIRPVETAEPVVIYALHAVPPIGQALWVQRNHELESLAGIIASDESAQIIFAGDWNITPYSPFFRSFIKQSGLFYAYSGIWDLNTWPSGHMLPILQIPIDHMIFNGGLKLTERKSLPALGSDHYPSIGTFSLLISKKS